MPSIIELDLGSLYDPKSEILISLLTTHSCLTKLKLGDLYAGGSQNIATHEYPTGSIHTLILGDNSLTDVVDLSTKYECGAQMFGSIKHLVLESSRAAFIMEWIHHTNIIRRLIHVLASKIPHFTWDPALSDAFPESHLFIDLHNHPSSKCLTLNFLPALVADEEEEEEDKEDNIHFNFFAFGLLETVATAVTIKELEFSFHDGCFESRFVDLIPPALFVTKLDSTLSESPFLELQRLIFSIPGAKRRVPKVTEIRR
ncbi:hypothetical protein BDQ12DRAFT_726160 [Crucibulum laeve]|uniref:Uncharacterized protein n=1 Tax=Crucibulum laeve TaxID=68775 RepID=A0A5C3LQ51_9AGAR|nr:hypothetical protein BDQ12DRAFT_726160 [Crucibulum laeve]